MSDDLDWSSIPDRSLLLVDSAPLIYFLEDDVRFAPRFAGLFELAAAGRLCIAVTTVSIAEVLVGPYANERDTLAMQIQAALAQYRVVPLTIPLAAQAARLRVRYRLRPPDAIQLASALEIGAWALVTHDRAFRSVQDVRVLS